jgi:hypothetical protein
LEFLARESFLQLTRQAYGRATTKRGWHPRTSQMDEVSKRLGQEARE